MKQKHTLVMLVAGNPDLGKYHGVCGYCLTNESPSNWGKQCSRDNYQADITFKLIRHFFVHVII